VSGTGAEEGWVHSRSTHHKHKIPRYLSAKSTGLLQKKDINRLTTQPVPSNAGLTQKKDIDRLTTEPVSSLTQKKDINKLTTEAVPPNTGLTQKKNVNKLTKVNNLNRHHEDNNNAPQPGCNT
jgi:hypothetical protein